VGPNTPVHVTLRVADHVWNLRSERSFRVIHAAVKGAQRDDTFRVVHFTVLGNHLHSIVEADGARALESGMRSLTIRLSKGLNEMMRRKGSVLADRYHAHVLRTPAEVKNALRYVLQTFESHAVRRGERASTSGWIDPFSSAASKAPRTEQRPLFTEPATAEPRGWLLRKSVAQAR
jgi:REP element-mobilizing transposase RayT